MTFEEQNILTGQSDSICLSASLAAQLIKSGEYRRSLGANLLATHFRRSNPDGSCFHLVITESGASLHRDQFDPQQGLDSFVKHLVHDAPVQTTLGAVLAVLIFRHARSS